MTTNEIKNTLVCAAENARARARKYAEAYIALNPQDKERRNRDLDLELLGIDNLYYRMMDELKADLAAENRG